MSTISESHAGLGKPANPNGIYAYHEAIGAQASPAVPPLFDDAAQVGPRAELGVRYAPGKRGFLDDPHEFYCARHARGTADSGCYGFLMTKATGSAEKKYPGINRAIVRSCSL